MLNWVDFLVILATALVFGAVVVAANNPHAKAQTRTSNSLITNLPQDISQAPDAAALVRARIRLAQGGPWT